MIQLLINKQKELIMQALNFPPRHPSTQADGHIPNARTDVSNDVSYINAPYQKTSEPVVVFFPSGNYNQLKELGRYKNLGVAMAILSSINHPDSAFQIPEYKIFSLETGAEFFTH
jgi:hypothetical protein